MLVIDASVAVAACVAEEGFQEIGEDLVAPPLMWSEVRSNLHLDLIKGTISTEDAAVMYKRLEGCPVGRRDPTELGRRAWELAERFGWGRTYDAEYVALAELLGCRLITLDARLRRGSKDLGFVIAPHELERDEPDEAPGESSTPQPPSS
jgi:predicted nucleic acid-binding protein